MKGSKNNIIKRRVILFINKVNTIYINIHHFCFYLGWAEIYGKINRRTWNCPHRNSYNSEFILYSIRLLFTSNQQV